MVLGTGYDFYLVHQSRHFFSENYTYEITRASPPQLGERPIKLDVGNFMHTATSSPTEGVINHGTLPIDSGHNPKATEFAAIYVLNFHLNISLKQLVFLKIDCVSCEAGTKFVYNI
jgi:hypothetical protein